MLKGSLLDEEKELNDADARPSDEDLNQRYGSLFGQAIADMWDRGGRDIWRQVPGSTGTATTEEKAADEAHAAMEE